MAGVLEHWGGQVGGDGFELMILAASFSVWNLGSLNLLSPEGVRSWPMAWSLTVCLYPSVLTFQEC